MLTALVHSSYDAPINVIPHYLLGGWWGQDGVFNTEKDAPIVRNLIAPICSFSSGALPARNAGRWVLNCRVPASTCFLWFRADTLIDMTMPVQPGWCCVLFSCSSWWGHFSAEEVTAVRCGCVKFLLCRKLASCMWRSLSARATEYFGEEWCSRYVRPFQLIFLLFPLQAEGGWIFSNLPNK